MAVVPSYYNTSSTSTAYNYNTYPYNHNNNNYYYHAANQLVPPPPPHGWAPAPVRGIIQNPPPYVEHQNAKKVRSDVNVHKNTLTLQPDVLNPDHMLLSFVFDAIFDGSITICYFAKEEPDCKFVPEFPETYMPVKIPFQKGVGQKFCQPSGTGIDLGFFELDDLSKPSQGEDIFPLVVCAETFFLPSPIDDDHLSDLRRNTSAHMQITQAVLEKNNDDVFQVRVVRQILWVDGVRYELREIYGMGSGSAAQDYNDSEPGKECCMCSECAKKLRIQSNKCPICRQPIEELIEIKINNSNPKREAVRGIFAVEVSIKRQN
ncbi:hypothetical protein ACFE04_006427 [Oxalis oulophora]